MLRTSTVLGAAALASAAAVKEKVTAGAGGHWSVIAPNVATEATGISFNGDAKTGFMAAGSNGSGSNVLRSDDGGNTWTQTHDETALLYLDVTSYGENVLAAATFVEQYSSDGGHNFVDSTGGALTAQCVRNLGPHDAPLGFGIAGQFGNLVNTTANGVGISTNDGASFTSFDAGLRTSSRYAAFPSATTWYVSAGEWPSSGSDQPTDQPTEVLADGSVASVRLTERMSLERNEKGQMQRVFHTTPRMGRTATNGSYVGELSKTTDGGKTWTSLFYRDNWAYFNGIDCIDEKQCCAVAECDSGPGAGAFIYCTWDGGAHWNQTYATNYSGSSLMDVRTVGTSGYWAVGGIINGVPEAAVFLYSSNAGRSWTVDTTLDGYYVTSVDCSVGTSDCWATVLDAEQTTSVAHASAV